MSHIFHTKECILCVQSSSVAMTKNHPVYLLKTEGIYLLYQKQIVLFYLYTAIQCQTCGLRPWKTMCLARPKSHGKFGIRLTMVIVKILQTLSCLFLHLTPKICNNMFENNNLHVHVTY
jgi:hypothetical protein